MQGVLYELDLITDRLTWSNELYTVFDHDRLALVGSADWWTNQIHPDDAMILNEAMDKLNDPSASGWVVEYRFKRGDNSYIWVRDDASIIRDADGKPIQLRGIITPKPAATNSSANTAAL